VANPTTNYGFVLPTPTDLVTDLPADFDVALQGVDTRLKALQPGTTLGDLVYSSATANTNTRLGIGTTGQVLKVAGGVPAWGTDTVGKLLQVVYYDSFTFTNNSSTTFAATGITGAITPTLNTSKVLVMVKIPWQYVSGTSYLGFSTRLNRGATPNITSLDVEAARNNPITSALNGSSTHMYLDSPATTSSTTYSVDGKVTGTSSDVYFGGQGQKGQLVLMEIGA
jgi:hypothetical protein